MSSGSRGASKPE